MGGFAIEDAGPIWRDDGVGGGNIPTGGGMISPPPLFGSDPLEGLEVVFGWGGLTVGRIMSLPSQRIRPGRNMFEDYDDDGDDDDGMDSDSRSQDGGGGPVMGYVPEAPIGWEGGATGAAVLGPRI